MADILTKTLTDSSLKNGGVDERHNIPDIKKERRKKTFNNLRTFSPFSLLHSLSRHLGNHQLVGMLNKIKSSVVPYFDYRFCKDLSQFLPHDTDEKVYQ